MLGILIAFIVINTLLFLKKQLYTAILAGLLLIVLFNPITPAEALSLFTQSLTSSMAVMLGLIVLFFTAFGNLLKETGRLRLMVEKLSLVLCDIRLQLAIIPALMGLLMFPGGAVFSAPLIEEAGGRVELDKERLVIINVLFRHVSYLIFPLYTTMILLGEISEISINRYIYANTPIFLLFLTFLCFSLFRNIHQPPRSRTNYTAIPALLSSLSPLLTVLILAILLNIYLPLAILAGITTALFSSYPQKPTPTTLKNRLTFIWQGLNWKMALAIISIIIFKDFLIQSNTVHEFATTLSANGVPLILLAVLIPYLTGFITGNHTAAIGISVPLILAAIPQPDVAFNYLAITFIAGLAGYQGSPLHMCTILTAQHFNSPLPKAIKQLNLYLIPLVIISTLYFSVLI